MKKYSLFFGIWLIGFALAPLIAFLTMIVFLTYRFIIRNFWRNDELLIKISVIIGLVGLFLGFFATGVPHIIQMFLKVIRLVVEFNFDSDSSSLLFSFWFLSLLDFWGWSVSSFSFAGLVYTSKDHREVMMKRETDRLADRFTDD